MASSAPKPSHIERTAAEPRDKSLNRVVLKEVTQINDQIRVFRLELSAPLRFLPGQWLDVYVPGIAKAGGYTITSTPSAARAPDTSPSSSKETGEREPYLELAVQKSPDAPAAWLWRHPDEITYAELGVRVGGGFVWPPPGINVRALRRVVFVAGGVGVNPLVSMVGALAESGEGCGFDVRFLYSVKDPSSEPRQASRILFLERLAAIFREGKVKGKLQLFLTGGSGDGDGVVSSSSESGGEIPFQGRRMTVDDVEEAVGGAAEKRHAVVYVCGVPTMTDDFVQKLTDPQGLGMEPYRVLCEKWW
ncbi:NADH-cytochrome b-5 reductase [Whalleya microplaca]|nr:NADH-cytochrome b-5 reductase [Whalleya microplaca]